MVTPDSGRHVLAVLLAGALWGTTGAVAHQAPAGSSHVLVGFATFGFGGLLLLALDRRPTVAVLQDASLRPLLGVAAAGVVTYAATFYVAMDLAGVAVGNAVALGSGPVFAALLELAVERRRVRRGWAVAAVVTATGVAALAVGHATGSGGGSSPMLGVLLALTAGLGYAVYSWSGARLITLGRHPSRSVMAAVFALAAVVLVPAFVVGRPGPLVEGWGPVVLVYLAVIPMAVAYLAFGYGLRRLRASSATTLALAEPVVATLLAVVVLGERLGAVSWAGLALIGCGLVLVAITERRQEPIGPLPVGVLDDP